MSESVRCQRCAALALGPPPDWLRDSRDPERWLCRACQDELARVALLWVEDHFRALYQALVRQALRRPPSIIRRDRRS